MMVGLSDKPVNPPFIILDKDRKILTDIAKKVYRGTALTDRQYATVKRVLRTNYSTQFKNRDIDIHASSNILRKPLRQIDRSSYIKIGNYKVVEKGEKSNSYNEEDLKKYMRDEKIDLIIDLGLGKENFTAYTMDLTKKYIEINADYNT